MKEYQNLCAIVHYKTNLGKWRRKPLIISEPENWKEKRPSKSGKKGAKVTLYQREPIRRMNIKDENSLAADFRFI